MFPKIGVGPQDGWFIMENPMKMDDWGGNTPIFGNATFLLREMGLVSGQQPSHLKIDLKNHQKEMIQKLVFQMPFPENTLP